MSRASSPWRLVLLALALAFGAYAEPTFSTDPFEGMSVCPDALAQLADRIANRLAHPTVSQGCPACKPDSR